MKKTTPEAPEAEAESDEFAEPPGPGLEDGAFAAHALQHCHLVAHAILVDAPPLWHTGR